MILWECMVFSYLALGASRIFCMRSMDSKYHPIQGLHYVNWITVSYMVDFDTQANPGTWSFKLQPMEVAMGWNDVKFGSGFGMISQHPGLFWPGSHVLVVKKDGSSSKWPQSDKGCKIMSFNFEPSHCTIPRSCNPHGSQLVARSVKHLLSQVGSEAIMCYVFWQQ